MTVPDYIGHDGAATPSPPICGIMTMITVIIEIITIIIEITITIIMIVISTRHYY